MSRAGPTSVVVVGGGVIGLSIAYALARRGVPCTVLDRREPGREASWAGAGLIPSPSEAGTGPLPPAVELRSWGVRLIEDWSAALRDETGIDNGFRRCGGVDVALTEAEDRSLRATAGKWRAEGVVHERLSAADIARVEPALGAEVRAAYFLPDRAQIRNPWHLRALTAAVLRRGGRIEPWRAVEGFRTRGDRVEAVATPGGEMAVDLVIVAAGAWSGRLLEGAGVRAPTPPVKGQIVLLRDARCPLRRIVEHGRNYLVPREDGRVLVGATEEDAGFDTRPTALGTRSLLEFALRLCPALGRAEVETTWAGLRPGSFDGRPYIGPAPGLSNLFVASGHRRAGLQLSAATAELMAELVLGERPRLDLAPFRLDREPEEADESFRS